MLEGMTVITRIAGDAQMASFVSCHIGGDRGRPLECYMAVSAVDSTYKFPSGWDR